LVFIMDSLATCKAVEVSIIVDCSSIRTATVRALYML
jgi:hypothetical protein